MSPKQRIEASTKVTSDECIFTWTIENYRLIKSKVGEKIESPQFGIGRDNKQYFQLLLYPKGDTAECAEYISLFLEPVIDSTNKSNETLKFFTTHTHLLLNSEKMKKIDDHDIWVNLTQSIVKSQKNIS
ncbi:hypothetical protein TKK_0003638 [Trichogramma kaykai]